MSPRCCLLHPAWRSWIPCRRRPVRCC